MKIRRTLIALLMLAMAGTSFAQESPCDNKYGNDSLETIRNISMFNQYYQQKEYVKAFPYWYYLYNNAPCIKKRITYSGPYLIKKAIQDSAFKSRQHGLIDTVFLVYQTRIDLWGDEGAVKAEWANDLGKLQPKRRGEAIAMFFESISMEGNNSSYKVPTNFIYAAIKHHKKKKLSLDSLLLIYDMLTPIMEHNMAIEGKEQQKWIKTKKQVDAWMVPYLDCDMIIELKKPLYAEQKNDVAYLRSTIKLLESGNCQDKAFYFELSEQLYSIEPSAASALALAKASLAKENYTKALDYYKQSLAGIEDSNDLYTLYIQIASLSIKNKNFSDGRAYAQKALGINGNSGDAYILIGDAYAASVNLCSNSKLKGREVYWVAVDKYAQARNVDSSVSDKATKRINKYSAYFPAKEDAFFVGVTDGQSYTVGCWIGESTVVRTIASN